ncbi:MAG: TIGR02677 family protein [Clostridia bacterium]|nr:TIGR02677 family protein [Clostridia bacterium]
MEINGKLLKQITETSYLTAENVARYRPILRYFYEEYETTNYMLYKEEVFDELKGKAEFEKYTLEMCENDLTALVNWGNLIAIQDTNNVTTVEEFKRRKFRYQLSPYAVEIERLVLKLENLHSEGGSLEPMLVERIKEALVNIDRISRKSENEVHGWWKNLNDDFKRLNQGYQDYIKTFYTVKMEEVAKSSQFIVYKNKLVKYLREFIKILQQNSYQIEEKLKNVDKTVENTIFEKILLGEKNIMRVDRIDEEIDEIEYNQRNIAKWENIKKWFIGSETRISEVEKINEKTTEIIRKITRIANQIAESKGNVSSKKAEYKKICEMFCKTESIEEAHKLSSLVFGMFNTRHSKGNFVRETDSINSSLIEEKSNEIEVKPRIRAYKEKLPKTEIKDKTQEKQRQIEIYMKKLEEERNELEKYIKDGKIDIKNLPIIKSTFRKTLLKWISKAGLMQDKQIVIEDGRKVKLLYPENKQKCILECEDGSLEMPAFVLEFVE